jgi:protein SCO1/2
MSKTRLWLIALVAGGLGIAAVGSSTMARRPADGDRRFQVTAVVVGRAESGAIAVAHDAIPDYMPAMTMPFMLADPRDGERLSPGDRVRFTLRVGLESSSAEAVVVTGRDALVANAAVPGRAGRGRLRPGDALPAFALVDQNGAPLSDADLRGHVTVVTFIFTRCPLPEYCPRIVGRFKQLQRAIVADASLADVHLLSVTLDPEFDSPRVLSEYGRAMGADFARWRFATGSPDQVAVVTQAFAVRTERSGGLIDHTPATALIDARGEVVELWRGNAWEVREILDTLHAGPRR